MSLPVLVRIGLWLWFFAAVGVGYSGLLLRLPLPALQGILFGLTALGLLAAQRVDALKAWLAQADLRALVLVHLTRFVGIYFLVLYRQGRLPYAFAVLGGKGDIAVAAGALLLCVLPLGAPARRHWTTVWNVVGTLDILFVVVTAARLGLQGNPQMRALAVLPLSLLPTFFVPLIIVTHILLFRRLRRDAATAAP